MGRKQVATRVSDEKKQQWSEYAAETHGSMTSLIRQAVDHYIQEDVARSSPGWDDTPQATGTKESTEMVERIDSLENTIESMRHEVSTVRESVQSSGPDYSFNSAVRESVPVAENGPEGDYYAEHGCTAETIAARLNADESEVSGTLVDLASRGEVEAVTGGKTGETVYVRTEGV